MVLKGVGNGALDGCNKDLGVPLPIDVGLVGDNLGGALVLSDWCR